MVHKMNANRISTSGVGTVFDNDEAIGRLKTAMINKSNKKKKAIRKVASVDVPKQDIEDNTGRLIIASLNDVPSDFERIGTGFYRQGHHLWQMSPADGGFVLVRKHGEDHVIDYDPEPITKQSNRVVKDRYGKEIKVGSKVIFPLRGKAAAGTVLIITPGVLDIGLDSGATTSCPPGMVECDESVELEENDEIETDSGDKSSCDEFEPKINKKPESDYVGPQSSQSGGVGGVTSKAAQQQPPQPATVTNMPAIQPQQEEYPSFQPGVSSRIVDRMTKSNVNQIIVDVSGTHYLIVKSGDDQYEAYLVSQDYTQIPQVTNMQSLSAFEKNIGQFQFMASKTASLIYNMFSIYKKSNIDINTWRDYWLKFGQKLAESTPSVPKPKMSEEEKKQRRKERAKQRKLERAGLPKGTKLPPKPKIGAAKTDDLAKLKERLRIYEQGIDALQYELNNIEDTDNDMMIADTVLNVIDDIGLELEELDEKEEQEISDELSIEKPSTMEEMGFKPQQQERVVVSMRELITSA